MAQTLERLEGATPTSESWLDRFARIMGRFVPDAITASIIFMLILAGMALMLGNSPAKVMDAYSQGLWSLLAFTMQMTLIITLSSVLGATPFFRKMIMTLSRLPKTTTQVVALAVLIVAVASYFYWGLGIALCPLVAIHFSREAERKGIPVDFLFLLAAVWGANACWQYGLSSSAALLMATPGHFLEKTTGLMPLSTTIWAPASILMEVAYISLVMIVGRVLMPKTCRPLSNFPDAYKLAEELPMVETPPQNLSERMERNSLILSVLWLALLGWLYNHFFVKRLSLDINALNTILLFLCLLLHRNIHRFTEALKHAVLSCWPVIVMYHLYAGVAGLIQHTSVGEFLAGMIAVVSTPYTFPIIAAISGTIVAVFVPSSGGQWVIQGFVTSKAAATVGLTMQRGLLALSVGDHMGNLTAPFWYMVVAGITRVNFREFYGYGLIYAALWFVVGVIVFTFAPC
ncbi:MAG: short-chain fatty acid transporter [Acidobacteria bacterium]|nr:short-chain fatty acid transporter [Acidobacteriota bacterium]